MAQSMNVGLDTSLSTGTDTLWARPKTTRRYLSPPKSERIYTLWAEGKLMYGEMIREPRWSSYYTQMCSGLWFVHGENDEIFDFKAVKNHVEPDGTPIHGLEYQLGNLTVFLESFCDTKRKSTAFARMKITNIGSQTEKEQISVLLRSGIEKQLVHSSADGYVTYDPDVQVWKDVWKTAYLSWRLIEDTDRMLFLHDRTFITAKTNLPHTWDSEEGILRFQVALNPGEETELIFSLGRSADIFPMNDALGHFDYEQERNLTKQFWAREFARITKLPESLKKDPERMTMVRHLTAQILQCFTYPVHEDMLMLRQGGLRRAVWPWEAMFGLNALMQLGDFSDYIEPTISAYFDVFQRPNGEIVHESEAWGSNTAVVLISFCLYSMNCSRQFFHKYKQHAMAGFHWMKNTRAQSASIEGCLPGFFPPLRSCDWDDLAQFWGNVDLYNFEALDLLDETIYRLTGTHDPEVEAEAKDYRAVIARHLQPFEKEAEQSDEYRIPLVPSGNDQNIFYSYPHYQYGNFVRLGFVTEENTDKLLTWMTRKNIRCEQLFMNMEPDKENSKYWYTTTADYDWFCAFKRLGREDRCAQILDSMIQYSMTAEYCMNERYMIDDPYFVPWSPNVSANARIIMMLLSS